MPPRQLTAEEPAQTLRRIRLVRVRLVCASDPKLGAGTLMPPRQLTAEEPARTPKRPYNNY